MIAVSNENTTAPVTLREKIFYGFGDFGNGMTFQFAQLYLLKYYTDVVGIPGYWAGLIFLIMKFADAFIDVSVGTWVDSRKKIGKRGKFRPFILYGAFFLAVAASFCFAVPHFNLVGKVIYAFVTYAVMNVLYSIVNIPYGSLATAMTHDSKIRANLSVSRSIGAQLAGIVTGFAVPVISFTGNGVPARGYLFAAIIFAAIGCISQWLCYRFTKENCEVKVQKNSTKAILTTVKSLCTSKPFIAIVLFTLFAIGAMFLQMGMQLYFYQYVMGNEGMMSNVTILNACVMFPTMFACGALVKKVDKKKIAVVGALVAGLMNVVGFFVMTHTHSHVLFYVIFGLAQMGLTAVNSVAFAFEADVVEYEELRTGVRSEGIIYSAYSFVRKVVQAIGGFVPGFALSLMGYVANQVQTIHVQHSIVLVFMLIPGIAEILAGIIFHLFYGLTDKKHDEIVEQLKKNDN